MDPLDRRQALAALGSVGFGAVLAACGSQDPQPRGSTPTATTPDDRFDRAASCRLTPEQAEGPFYFDVDAIRSDIRDGRDGTRLTLALRVRDAESCEPIKDAVVDIWHCDAAGAYSLEGERFLRGTQVTDSGGAVEFRTIYPGAYQGRTVHIHAKVHLDRETVLTTQLYFDEPTSERVLARAPYSRGGTTNASDSLFDDALVASVEEEPDGYRAAMNFDVARA